jgi:hypothetical protein
MPTRLWKIVGAIDLFASFVMLASAFGLAFSERRYLAAAARLFLALVIGVGSIQLIRGRFPWRAAPRR